MSASLKLSLSRSFQGNHLDSVLGYNFCDKGGLVNNEARSQLSDALAHGHHAFLQGHALLEVVVEDGVHEVARIPVRTFCHLLQGTQVVHPVQLRLLLNRVKTTHQYIDLKGSARAKRRGHF